MQHNKAVSFNLNIEFEIFDLQKLPYPPMKIDVDFEIRPIERRVRFIAQEGSRVSTILSASGDGRTSISEDQVAKAPHDLVHASLHPFPESTIIDGFTPDVCIPVGNGQYDVVEIATTESLHLSAVTASLKRKVQKYGPLANRPNSMIRSLNVVVVNKEAAYDLKGTLDARLSNILVDSFHKGLSLVNRYAENPGFKTSNRVEPEEAKQLRDMLSSEKSRQRIYLNEQFTAQPIPSHPQSYVVGKGSIEKKSETFAEYEARMMSRSNVNKDKRSAKLHIPMLLVDARSKVYCEADASEIDSIYANLFNSCLSKGLRDDSRSDFEMLRMLSELDSNPKPIPKDHYDTVRVALEEPDRLELASRGVAAVRLKMVNHPEIEEKRRRDKLDIPYDLDLWDLDEFVEASPLLLSDPCISFEEVSQNLPDSSMCKFPSLIEDVSRIEDIQACKFLNLVNVEIQLNLLRNPRDDARGTQFLFRVIPGYEAFVVIRNSASGRNDQAHTFYCIFFKGKTISECFEDVYELDNDWCYTKFLSTDQERLSQMQGLHIRAVWHWACLVEDICPRGFGLTDKTTIYQFIETSIPFRNTLLILLEDKGKTSETLQDFRYYYMEVTSRFHSSIARSEKIASRFPDMIRSPILLRFIRSLISIHHTLKGKYQSLNKDQLSEHSDEYEDETGEGERDDHEEASYEMMEDLMTPFGFQARTPSLLVRAMYMGYLHNKNEGFSGHGEVKMLEKTLKMAYKFRDLKLKPQDEWKYCAKLTMDQDDLTDHQHSRIAMKHACSLLREKLSVLNSVDKDSLDSFLDRKIVQFMLRSTLSELATTKSSTLPFENITIESSEDPNLKTVQQRRKCIEAILHNWDDFSSNFTALNFMDIETRIEGLESGSIKVTLFKKKQIGGTREIYVLTIRGRIITKVFSDVYRAICEMCPGETLTKPENKKPFVSNHFGKRAMMSGRYRATYKVSADMTTWSQSFNLFSFADVARFLLPKTFHEFCYNVIEFHKSKELQIPSSLINNFLKHPETKLSSKEVQRMKDEFLGQSKEAHGLLSGPHTTTFKNSIDMMQGILHYPSSLFHVCVLEYKSDLIRTWFKKEGVELIVDYLCSSDDEGMLISMASDDKEHLKKTMGRFHNFYERCELTINKLFGLRTSWHKTTRTYSQMFEYNSEFYFGNTCQHALSKFENNAIFHDPAESLDLGIASLYAKLRELRANGASGAQCHFASLLQLLNFTMDLGVGVMSWYRPGLYKQLTESRTTISGFYYVFDELKAGLMDTTYVNWLAARDGGEFPRRILHFLGNYSLPLSTDEHLRAKFTVYPSEKYRKMIHRLGLTGRKQSDMDDSLFKILLVGSKTLEEEKEVIIHSVLTPNIARSMAMLNRTHVGRMTAYVLWAAMYKDQESHKKYSLVSLIEKCRTLDVNKEWLSLSVLFPMSQQFELIHSMGLTKRFIGPVLPVRRLYPAFVCPQYYLDDSLENMIEVVSYFWFGERRSLTRTQCENFMSELQSHFPWLDRSFGMTKIAMPFESLKELYDFLKSSKGVVQSFSALVRGRPRKSFSSIQALARHNTFSRQLLFLDIEEPVIKSSGDIYEMLVDSHKISDRLKAWKDILSVASRSNDFGLLDLLADYDIELKKMSKILQPQILASRISSHAADDRIIRLASVYLGMRSLKEYAASADECLIYQTLQTRDQNSWTGDWSYVEKKSGVLYRAVIQDQKLSVHSSATEGDVKRVCKIPISEYSNEPVSMPLAYFIKTDVIKGNLVHVFSDGLAEYYMDLPRTYHRSVHLDMPTYEPLSSFLSRSEAPKAVIKQTLEDCIIGRGKIRLISRSLVKMAKSRDKKISPHLLKRAPDKDEPDPDEPPSADFNLMDLDDIIGMIADVAPKEVNLVDFAEGMEDFLDDIKDDFAARNTGMEALAMESVVSEMETNRIITQIISTVKAMKRLDPGFLSQAALDAIAFYDKL